MSATLAAVVFAVAPVAELPTAVWQVAPPVKARFDHEPLSMIVTKPRAVLLVPGLSLHPLRPERAGKPELHDWTHAKAELVQVLAADFDVYSFGYAQTVPADAVSLTPVLRTGVEKLRAAGYADVTLIGHSAGGLIARQFAERFPVNVAKVIMVAAPHGGAELANVSVGVPRVQTPFVRSLAPKARTGEVGTLPEAVAACCVACKVPRLGGDTLVSLESQWPADLRRQGVPVALIQVSHFDCMRAPRSVALIAELAREPLVRWTPEQVKNAAGVVFGKEADSAAMKKPGRPLTERIVGKSARTGEDR